MAETVTPAAETRDSSAAARLAGLRAELARRGLDGIIVPRADAHRSEYLAAPAERLRWLTGFSGSAGLAVVLRRRAAIFVDGRYTLQVREQVDGTLYDYRHLTEQPAEDWIAEALGAGERLGYDPWLHGPDEVDRYRRAARRAGGELVACEGNPVDAVWADRPSPPLAPVVAHDLAFAVEVAADKRTRIGAAIAEAGAGAAVLSAPESIAWLLNIRGGDVAHCPITLAFATIDAGGRVTLFIDRRKLSPGIEAHLGDGVTVEVPEALGPALDGLAAGSGRLLVDPASNPAWIFDRIAAAGGEAVRAMDPCALPKARKNPVEIAGARRAHHRDGAALVRFLAWFDRTAPAGTLHELSVVERLAALRAEGENYRGPSFDTIAGAGPNGAIVHYRPTPATDRRIEPDSLVLIDSGGQYLDGTTDVTRTVTVGTPPEGARRAFTAVLKGHIALATLAFPAGTSGSQIDAFARMPLWRLGLDYDHGTGHGVGSYLGVHEGPQRISKLPNTVALEPGMLCSNEPGYYREGAFGIRIESLVTVIALATTAEAEKAMLGFETLTRAPIDRRLIDPDALDEHEIAWLDAYHVTVRESLTPLLDAETAAWLAAATRPLAEG